MPPAQMSSRIFAFMHLCVVNFSGELCVSPTPGVSEGEEAQALRPSICALALPLST